MPMKPGHKKNIGSLFIISAPSGAGKTTLCKELCKTVSGLKHSVSYTTRQRRKGERNRTHYFFVNEKTFKSMIKRNDFAEWAMVHGNLYGTSKKHIKETIHKGYDIILDIDVNGAMQMRRKYKDAYYIFILPPSLQELKKRLRRRKSDPEAEIQRRLGKAKDEIAYYHNYDYIVVNDRFKKALSDLAVIVSATRLRRDRLDNSVINKIS